MRSTTKISGKMIPAVESGIARSSIGDMGSVPIVNAVVKGKGDSISCIAVIDTGAEVSLLDKSLFRLLGDQVPDTPVALSTARGIVEAFLCRLQIKLQGERGRRKLVLKNVPVVVTDLGRQLLMLGRKGALERLLVEINFPRGKVSLTRPITGPEKYSALARELPRLQEAIDLIKGKGLLQGIRMLALEIERFSDGLVMSDARLRNAFAGRSVRSITFKEKLLIICQAMGYRDLIPDVETVVHYRNIAAHARCEPIARSSAERFLEAAERIVSRFSP